MNGKASRQLLRVPEAAKMLGLKPCTIRRWVFKRNIAYVRLGRAVGIPIEEIDRLIKAGWHEVVK